MVKKGLSFLSELDFLKCWLDTPIGYYVDKPNFGNNLKELMFKNKQDIRLKLHLIMDKIEEDLGNEVADNIDSIKLIRVDEIDKLLIAIRYNNEMIFKEVE